MLIRCGEKDMPIARQVADIWHVSEPNSKLLILKDAGHLVNMDVPDKFNVELLDFIEHN